MFSRRSSARFGCGGQYTEPSEKRVVTGDAASSGLRPSQEVFNWLRPLPTVPALRVLLAVPWRRRARSMLHVIMHRRGGVATDRHGRWIKITPRRCVLSRAHSESVYRCCLCHLSLSFGGGSTIGVLLLSASSRAAARSRPARIRWAKTGKRTPHPLLRVPTNLQYRCCESLTP
jgi:hypothetical protein